LIDHLWLLRDAFHRFIILREYLAFEWKLPVQSCQEYAYSSVDGGRLFSNKRPDSVARGN